MFDKPFRSHPISIFESSIQRFLVFLFIFLQPNYKHLREFTSLVKELATHPEERDALLAIMHENSRTIIISLIVFWVIVILYIVFSVLIWRRKTFCLKGNDLIITSGRLNKKEYHLHCQDISNINLTQNFLERLTNTYRLSLDTNTSSTSNKTDFTIILKKATAFAFKEAIDEQRSQGMHTTSTTETISQQDDATSLWIISSTKDLFVHIMCQIKSLNLALSFIGLNWLIIYFSIKRFTTIGNGEQFQLFSDITQSFFDLDAGMIIPLLLLILPILRTTVGIFFRFYGFKIRRLSHQLELEYGFFTKQTYHIPIEKIGGLVYQQTFIQRLFGYVSIEIINIGMGDDSQENKQILLTDHLTNINRKLQILLPEFYHLNKKIEAQPKAVLGQLAITKTLPRFIILSICIVFLPHPWAFFLIPLYPLWIIQLWFAYKSPGLSANNDTIIIAKGAVDRHIILLPWSKIETVTLIEGPVSQRLQHASLQFSILAQSLQTEHRTGTFSKAFCQKFYNHIDPDKTK